MGAGFSTWDLGNGRAEIPFMHCQHIHCLSRARKGVFGVFKPREIFITR